MARGITTITFGPYYNARGNKAGWQITDGKHVETCSNQEKCAKEAKASIRNWLAAGKSVILVVNNSQGAMVSKTLYKYSATTDTVTVVDKTPGKKAPSKKAPSKKASTTKKASSKGKRGISSGLKRYQAFQKAAKSAGATAKQARAYWAKNKAKATSIATAKALGAKVKGARTSTRKASPSKASTRKVSTALPGRKLKAPGAKKASTKKSSAKKSSTKKSGGTKRKASAYNIFAKKFFKAHPVSNYRGSTAVEKSQARMKALGKAWQAAKNK